MCQAPLIERFDCEKVIVIEDSGQQGKTDLVRVNGVNEIGNTSEVSDISKDIIECETKENNGIIECNGNLSD